MVVWLAATRVYPCQTFLDYALLGDDIVIADKHVALAYERIMGWISIRPSLKRWGAYRSQIDIYIVIFTRILFILNSLTC